MSARSEKLLATLQSMSQKYPSAQLMNTKAGFGVSWGDGHYLYTFINGPWTGQELTDWLGLFKLWLEVDIVTLLGHDAEAGSFVGEIGRLERSSGPLEQEATTASNGESRQD